MLKWIEDFLSEREQFVEIQGEHSERVEVTSGVPQGSVLGPVLFLISVNDLVSDSEFPTLMLADDAKIFVKINSDEDIQSMTRDLKRLQNWSYKWLLNFNPDKCSTMHIGHRNPNVVYNLNGKDMKPSDVEKDLGVMIFNDLKPANHIGVISAKANRMVGLIKRNFTFFGFGNVSVTLLLSCKTTFRIRRAVLVTLF